MGGELDSALARNTFRTALARSQPSVPARLCINEIKRLAGLNSKADTCGGVLDFGCGHGCDVAFFRTQLDAEGFDPHPGFGFTRRPTRHFQVVTVTYVLNVIANPIDRIAALKDAASYLTPGGCLIVTVRSPEEIERKAKRGGWIRYGDGYVSSINRGTFQRGISVAELKRLGRLAGLKPRDDIELPPIPRAAALVLISAGGDAAGP